MSLYSNLDRAYWPPKEQVGPPPDPVTYATPKVAGIRYGGSYTQADYDVLGKCGVAILANVLTVSATTAKARVDGVRAAATAIGNTVKIFGYVDLPEANTSNVGPYGSYDGPPTKATAQNWWLVKAGTSTKVQSFSPGSTIYDINYTNATTVDSNGDRYPQYYAKLCEYIHTRNSVVYDGYFCDNSNHFGTVTADWDLSGSVDTDETDATTRAAMRAGHRAFWDAIRVLSPTRLLLGNNPRSTYASEWFGDANISGQMDGGFMEQGICRPNVSGDNSAIRTGGWSQADTGSTSAVWENWVRMVDGTGPYSVFQGDGTSATDYDLMRLTLATALLADRYALFTTVGTYTATPLWFDEYNQQLGAPIDPRPTVKVAGTTCIWKRRFENGVILINGKSAPATLFGNYEPGAAETIDNNVIPYGVYKRITSATQTPSSFYDGTTVNTSFSLPGWDAIMLLCVTPGVHS